VLKLRTLFEGVIEHPNGQLEHFMEEQSSTVRLEALLNVRVHKLREDVRSKLEPLTELPASSWPQRRNTVDS
jgi:hypothetical protein